ncbi:MAG: hypothetical protein FWE05_12110 [Defluviitaleaceae bacterium]|nr:hypothetical protein [Defluviitaleaceae bacterium]
MLKEFAPMNAAELFDRTIDVYKKSFGKQLAFAAIMGVISFIGMMIFGFVLAFIIIFSTATFLGAIAIDEAVLIILPIIVVLVLSPLLLLWTAVSNSGHMILAKQAFYGHYIKLPYAEMPKMALRVFTALLAQFLLIIPFILVVGGLAVLLFPVWDMLFLVGYGNVLPVVSLVLFVLLTVVGFAVFTNIFAVTTAVAIFEDKYFFSAVSRAFGLIRDEFWRILGIRILWIAVIFTTVMSIQGVFAIVQQFSFFFAGSIGTTAAILLALFGFFGSIVSIAANFLIMPLDGIFQTMIYFNQRIKKDGLDIEIAIEKTALPKYVQVKL